MNIFVIRLLLAGQTIICGLLGTLISFTLQNETGAMLIGIIWLITLSILTMGNLFLDKFYQPQTKKE